MPKQPFLIADFKIGEKTDVKPFLLPNEAFEKVEDAFIFRGRVEKRPGFNEFNGGQLNSRLRINVGTTALITGDLVATIMPGTVWEVGQMISVGTTIFTITTAGVAQPTLSSGTATATFDTTTGSLVITGNNENPNTTVYFYPSQPVMGLLTRELVTINFEETIAFDTQFSYHRVGTGWDRLDPLTGWTGTNYNFFSGTNWRGLNNYDRNFFVVNYNAADNIKYLPQGLTAWTNLRPQLDSGVTRHLETAKIIIVFKDRLLVLNTIEDESGNDRNYPNRCRFSQNGDPTTAATSWLDDVIGRGGYVDADTSEAIIGAEFVKDRMIVFFERSTYELVYTGNEILPFRWQKINTELGCESSFSPIAFDDGVLAIGNRGIHIANTGGVQRIDIDIPDEIHKINDSNQGHERVYGIRDYFREVVYWTFPSFVGNPTFPNRVIVYNYKNNTWSFFNDRFTCYGYHQKTTGLTWATLPYKTWSSWNQPWNAGPSQAQFPLIIAGNHQGWTNLFEQTGTNDPSLQVTDLLGDTVTVINHNLQTGQYIKFAGITGATLTDQVYLITEVLTVNTFTFDGTATGIYTGNGTIEVLNKFNIKTKEFNFFWNQEMGFETDEIIYLFDRTENGEVTARYYVDGNDSEEILPLWGNNTVNTKPEDNETFTNNQDYIWHRDMRNLIANSVQLNLTLDDAQMRDTDIQSSDMVLNAILFKVEPAGRL